MTSTPIRKLLQAAPFAPFSVQLAHGKSRRIPHPDFAYLSPPGLTLIVYSEGEAFEIIDVGLITNLSIESGAASAK